MNETMGQIIKRLRKERNLTQEELAEQLNISAPAISKWENDTSMPDISQVVPLASVFGVSTDVIFGVAGMTSDEEAWKIIKNANEVEEYGKLDTYLSAYDKLIAGLKKHPNNLILLNNCMKLGLSLCMPENGWIYARERAKEISTETIRQAKQIIQYSQNISDIMSARQALVFLYSANQDYEAATREAREFPVRTDFTLYSNMARVNEYMGDYQRAITYLCSDIDYSLQALEDNTARLGKAYYNCEKYNEAIEVYNTFFKIIKAIFKDERPRPYHDFDSGDCYILMAQAYLAIGETDNALDQVENSVRYYLDLYEDHEEMSITINSAFLRETENLVYIHRDTIKKKLFEKLSSDELMPLADHPRYKDLVAKVEKLK